MKPYKPVLLASKNLDDLYFAIITMQSNRVVNPLKAVADGMAARDYLMQHESPALVLLPFDQMEFERDFRTFAPVLEFTNLEDLTKEKDFCGLSFRRGIGGFVLG